MNLCHLRLLTEDPEFRTAAAQADRLCADGWPVALLARRLGMHLERVTGSGLLFDLVADLRPGLGRRVALAGASQDSGRLLRRRLAESGRRLVFADHGRASEWDERTMAAKIRASRADLVLISVSPPLGEVYAAALADRLPDRPVIAVGGAVDMIGGTVPRAPTLWRRLGLEWVWRMCQEPRRLASRYLGEDVPFFARQVVPLMLSPDRMSATLGKTG